MKLSITMLGESSKLVLLLSDNIEEDAFLEEISKSFKVKKHQLTNESVIYITKVHNPKHDVSLLLSKKEELLLKYLKEGKKYEDIAVLMDIGINGVRYYTKKIYKKLGAKNSREALMYYKE